MPNQITIAMKTEAAVIATRGTTAWMAGMMRGGKVADPITFFAIVVASK